MLAMPESEDLLIAHGRNRYLSVSTFGPPLVVDPPSADFDSPIAKISSNYLYHFFKVP
jgi:hypothetical protein